MYRNPLVWAGVFALVMLGLFLGVATYELAHLGYALRHNSDTVTASLKAQVDGADLPTVSKKISTAMDDVHATMKKEQDSLDADNILIAATLAGVDEDVAHFGELVNHIDATQANVGKQVVGTLSEAQTTMKKAQPVLDNTAQTMATTNTAIAHTDATVNSPATKDAIANTAKVTEHAANITDTADKVMTKATKPYLDPTPKTFWQKVKGTLGVWLPIFAKTASAAL